MSDHRKLLIATSNRGKAREMRAILSDLPVTLLSLADFPPLVEPVEDADTFEGNARTKAIHYARLTNTWSLADDSGLVVNALNGAPGVKSARYAGMQCDAAANNAKLIAALADIDEDKRQARFCCAIAVASPTEVLAVASGTVEGVIVDDPVGHNGFGYDPHFFMPAQGQTAAELSPEVKNSISHRARALQAIRPRIEELLSSHA